MWKLDTADKFVSGLYTGEALFETQSTKFFKEEFNQNSWD